MDRSGVHIDGGNLFVRGQVPQLDRAVNAAGSEDAAVGRIGQRLEASGMPFERRHLLGLSHIPDLDRLIVSS